MADRASSFMRDWISENIHNDPTWGDRIEERTAAEIVKLKTDAKEAGIDLSDPEMDDDLLRDEVHAAIENVYDPEAGGDQGLAMSTRPEGQKRPADATDNAAKVMRIASDSHMCGLEHLSASAVGLVQEDW